MDSEMLYIILAFPVVLVLLILADWFRQSEHDFAEALSDELSKSGATLVAVKVLPPFSSGPFPFIRFQLFGPGSGLLFSEHRRICYRKLTYRARTGELFVTWVRINVKAGKPVGLDWRPSVLHR